MRLSQSTINQFNKCKFLFETLHVRGLESAIKDTRMTLGTLVHAGLAAHFRNQPVQQALVAAVNKQYPADTVAEFSLVDEARKQALELLPEAEGITLRAIHYLGDEWETVHLNGEPLIEKELEVVLPIKHSKPVRFVFIVDWVARHKPSNQVWLFDHKTRVNIQPDEVEDYNMQMAIYQYLLRSFGVDTVGSICFQIRSMLPREPSLNKNGTMSRTEIASDWGTYRDALLRYGLNPLEYQDMATKLANKEFFRLSRSFRTADLLQRIWEQVVSPTIIDILDAAELYTMQAVQDIDAPRNIHSVNCKLCSIREYCHAKLRGYDVGWFFESGAIIPREVEDE